MVTKKREDTAAGCRLLARDDEVRAVEATNTRMRSTLERSAKLWASRAKLLDRLETEFNARAEALALQQERHRAERTNNG